MFGSHLNLGLWIFVVIVIWAIIQGLFSTHYLFFDPDHYAFVQQRLVYVANASSILLHIGLGVVALMIGPCSFSKALESGTQNCTEFAAMCILLLYCSVVLVH